MTKCCSVDALVSVTSGLVFSRAFEDVLIAGWSLFCPVLQVPSILLKQNFISQSFFQDAVIPGTVRQDCLRSEAGALDAFQ